MTARLKRLALLTLALSLGCLAQEFPGGAVQVRASLTSERGSYPTILVQSVPDSTTTATCLAIRHGEAKKVGPKLGAAHLLEHLLFRTKPGGRPGGLLLRSESLGNQTKAWVTPTTLFFSELVPAENGLGSLDLQLSRLKGVPADREGIKFEKQSIAAEIRQTMAPQDQARYTILDSMGYTSRQAGSQQSLAQLQPADLASVLKGLKLDEDIVITVIGPHTAREVRQHLSKNLKPLLPARTAPREAAPEKAPVPKNSVLEPENGSAQASLFFHASPNDPRSLEVAQLLLDSRLKPGQSSKLHREDSSLFRLDLAPPTSSLDPVLSDLTTEQSNALFDQLRRSWLERYEAQQERAEMLAQLHLWGHEPRGVIERSEFNRVVEEARELLRASQAPVARLETRPKLSTDSRLFQYKDQSNRTPRYPLESQSLPNKLRVSTQRLESWPAVAISGFFRISPPLSARQAKQLTSRLNGRADLELEYEVLPTGIFFHQWTPKEKALALLSKSAAELQVLAAEKNLLPSAVEQDPGVVTKFFAGNSGASASKALTGEALFQPKNGHLVIVGDIEVEQLDQGLRPAWSGWFGSGKPRPLTGSTKAANTSATLPPSQVIETPTSSRPLLLIGVRGPTRSSPDFLAFNLALQTLAGRPQTSLLARRLQTGTTSVSSVKLFPLASTHKMSKSGGTQVWVIALRLSQTLPDPKPVVKKVAALVKNLGLRTLPSGELDRTRHYLKSRLTLSASTLGGRARVIAHAEFHRLSTSYTENFAGLYDNLTPDLVKAVSSRYLAKGDLRWLYFKPSAESTK